MRNYLRFFLFPIGLFLCPVLLSAQGDCIKGDCIDGYGEFKFPSGTLYKGNFQNGVFQGRGTCVYYDKSVYTGWWEDRLPNGMGTLTEPDGKVKSGLWKNGHLIDESGNVLDSEFIMKTIDSGEIQYGCLQGDCENGPGLKAFPDGSKYEGFFKDGKCDGMGKWFYPNGDILEINWVGNVPHGKGVLKHIDDSVTEGIWDNGTFLGETKANGIRDCNRMDCENGTGRYVYTNGFIYEGEFKDGVPFGWGNVDFGNGANYTGFWKSGKANGFGTYLDANGKSYVGTWKDGQMLRKNLKPEPQRQTVAETETSNINSLKRPKIWAVIIGVSSYSHMPALRYADNDAFHLARFLQSPEGGAVPDEQLRILIDEDATRESILVTMEEIYGQAEPEDMVMLYFSGHGQKGCFLPIDFDGFNNRLYHYEINDIFNSCKAKHKVFLADACHSGSYALAARGEVDDMVGRFYDGLKDSAPGTALILSSKPEETSLESLKVRQGVFSYYLLKGLKGEADYNFDGIVMLQELYKYLSENVSSYTNYRQTPVLKGDYDGTMPVGVIRKR